MKFWLHVVFLILFAGVAFLFQHALLLFFIGVLPTGVATLVDRSPGRYAPITVGSMNLLGLLVMHHHHAFFDRHVILRTSEAPAHWVVVYGLAALGWLLHITVPQLVLLYFRFAQKRRMEALLDRQEELVTRWGVPVKAMGRHKLNSALEDTQAQKGDKAS